MVSYESGRPSPLEQRRRRHTLLARRPPLLPIGVWIVATAVVLTTCALSGRSPFRTATWIHWDSYLYLDIARHGSTAFHCPGAAADIWCGNAGWFPGYAWLIRGLGGLGFSEVDAAIAISWLGAIGALVLLWATFLGRRIGPGVVLALLYAAFAPGQVYTYAVDPISVFVCGTIAYLWFLDRERWLGAGLTGAALVLVYPVGFVPPAIGAAWLLVAFRRISWRERLRRIAVAVGPAIGSLGFLFVFMQLTLGHWNAFFIVQKKYGHGPYDPLAPTLRAIGTLAHRTPFRVDNATAFQTLLVSVVLICVITHVVRQGRRVDRTEAMLVLWAIAAWAVPAAANPWSIYRAQAALLPVAVLVGRLPRALAAVLIVAAVAVSVPLELMFLRNLLE
jgi:hypothetical protein